MTLYTTLDCRMQEKWIHTNIWKGNNHITSGTWCSHNKMFPQLDSTESRRHKLCQIDPTRHQNDILSRVLLASVDPVSTFCHHTMSTKSTINYTTFSSGIIKKKEKRKHPSCFLHKLLFLIPSPSHSEAISYITDGSQTNVLETCSTAIIRVNAVRNPKSLIYTLPKNQSIHHCLVVYGLWVNKEVGKWDQNVIRSVQPTRSYMT